MTEIIHDMAGMRAVMVLYTLAARMLSYWCCQKEMRPFLA